MSSSSVKVENQHCTSPEIRDEAQNVTLPDISQDKYMIAYVNFLRWKKSKNASSFSENVFMDYFKELANYYKPNSMWCIYSMLKTTVLCKHGVDIKTYSSLRTYLKRASNGYRCKKTKELTQDDVEKFIKEAPDHRYLAIKVALIMGIIGGCRRQELANITIKDIEHHGQMILVKIKNTKNKTPRSFTIDGPFYEIVKKYESLRSTKAKTDRFLLNYQNGKCTSQPIFVKKFGSMPKKIAMFLGLEEAEAYTGYSYRRISAKIQASSGADDGRRSNNEAKSYVEDSIQIKSERAKITQKIHLEPKAESYVEDSIQIKTESAKFTQEIYLEPEAPPSTEVPCSSNDQVSPTNTINGKPPHVGRPSSSSGRHTDDDYDIKIKIEKESVKSENAEVETPSKTVRVHYSFRNCTVTNCFKK